MEDYLKGYIAGLIAGMTFLAALCILAQWAIEDTGPRYALAIGEENAGPGLDVVDGGARRPKRSPQDGDDG